MLSPAIGLTSPRAPFSPPNLSTLTLSPNTNGSPYRLPPIPKSSSGNDLVSGIVDKFNSLSVTDREEERSMHERQIAKLKAALDRACMAREEAESEARRLREKLLEMQEERVQERDELRGRVGEWERKYEKAKDRFKLQRVRNEEAMHKAQSEFLEKEKGHWRNVAVAQEAEEWERKLRIDAHDLLEYIELEGRFQVHYRTQSRHKTTVETITISQSAHEGTLIDLHEPLSHSFLAPRAPSRAPSEEMDRTERFLTPDEHAVDVAVRGPDSRDVTPDGPPSIPIIPFRASQPQRQHETSTSTSLAPPSHSTHDPTTPARQVLRIPVDFGEEVHTGDEDKENAAPRQALVQQPATCGPTLMRAATTPAAAGMIRQNQKRDDGPEEAVLKTPMTIDRAAALAAIEYRRGRAKSFVNAMTPRKVSGLVLPDKRDLSAPAMTMSLGKGAAVR